MRTMKSLITILSQNPKSISELNIQARKFLTILFLNK